MTKYMDLIAKVLREGAEEPNHRTGLKTKRLLGAVVDLTREDGIFSPRKMSLKIAAAELGWQLSGLQGTEWLSKYTSIWKKFEEPAGYIETAYGFRWRYSFGRDQISELIELLKKDPSTRQGLVISWDPRMDGLMNQGRQKNVPCPFAFSMYVKEGKGFMVVYQRSADIIIGIPYDLLDYYMLGQAIFNSVGYPFAGIRIMMGDAHIYENLYDVAKRMIGEFCPPDPHCLDHTWTVEQIVAEPDKFVAGFAELYRDVDWPILDRLDAAQ